MSVLSDKVLSLRDAGVVAVHEILRELLAPTITTSSVVTARPTANAEKALQDLVVPALMTKGNWTAYAAAGALEDQVEARAEKKIKDAVTDADRLAALYLERMIAIAEKRIRRRGGDPYSPTATTAGTTVTIGTTGGDPTAAPAGETATGVGATGTTVVPADVAAVAVAATTVVAAIAEAVGPVVTIVAAAAVALSLDVCLTGAWLMGISSLLLSARRHRP